MIHIRALSQLCHNLWLQKSVAVLLFVALAWAHYQLAHVPVSLNIESCEKCTPLKTLSNQKLLISNIISGMNNQTLFAYTGDPNQTVNIHFDKARLDDKSVNNLKHFIPDIPITPQPIDFNTTQSKSGTTFINITLRKPAVSPNAIELFRDLASDRDQPDFKMRVEALDLAVEIGQINSSDHGSVSDGSDLKIGGWRHKLAGIPVTIIPENHSNIAFRFFSPDWNPEKMFEPFFIEGGEVISALAAGTAVIADGNQIFDILLCGAPSNKKILLLGANLVQGICPNKEKLAPLRLTSFNIGREHVQVAVAGNAWVLINGEPVTIDVIALIKENPYLSSLLAGFDALALAWIKYVIFMSMRRELNT